MLRIFFASDVHGSEVCFRKFVNAGKAYKANVLILGGDITGKMIIPILQQKTGAYTADFSSRTWIIRNNEELENFMKMVRNSGYYPYLTNEPELTELSADGNKVNKLFSELMLETVRRWVKIAEERLRGTGISCYVTPGNDDRFIIDEALSQSDYVVNPEGKVVSIAGAYEMISTGFSNMTPWKTQRELSEDELERKIENMASNVKNMETCIFNLHCPPFDTLIDKAPQLDETLKVVTRSGEKVMIPVGSVAARNVIKKYQPLLGLHGHIHESRGVEKLGRTLCLNPGSEYNEGILRGVIINLENDVVKNYLFTSG